MRTSNFIIRDTVTGRTHSKGLISIRFIRTGNTAIDSILDEIESAVSMYHNTERWYGVEEGEDWSAVDVINGAIRYAASKLEQNKDQ